MNKLLLQRWRIMCVNSGIMPADSTDDDLLAKVRGNTMEEKERSLEKLTSLVNPEYWGQFN